MVKSKSTVFRVKGIPIYSNSNLLEFRSIPPQTPKQNLESTSPLPAKSETTDMASSQTEQEPTKASQVSTSCTQKDLSAVSPAAHSSVAQGQLAERPSQTLTDASGGPQPNLECERYREASTMTSLLPPTPLRQRHDIEVQAVANTCTRGVCTSPSLLPLTVTRRPSAGAGVDARQVIVSAELQSERLTVEAEMCPKQNSSPLSCTDISPQQDSRLGAKPKEGSIITMQYAAGLSNQHRTQQTQRTASCGSEFYSKNINC